MSKQTSLEYENEKLTISPEKVPPKILNGVIKTSKDFEQHFFE